MGFALIAPFPCVRTRPQILTTPVVYTNAPVAALDDSETSGKFRSKRGNFLPIFPRFLFLSILRIVLL